MRQVNLSKRQTYRLPSCRTAAGRHHASPSWQREREIEIEYENLEREIVVSFDEQYGELFPLHLR